MALDPAKNFAKVNVSTGYDADDTSIDLAAGQGAKLPAPGSDGAFNLVWWNASDYPNPSDDPNVEIVRCTARSTDNITISRAQESTSGSTKNTAGKTYKMALGFTKKMRDDIETRIAATEVVANGAIQKSLGTTKGDVIGFSGNATPVRVGVGTDGYVITADAASTPGFKWAAIPGGAKFGGSGADGALSITSGTTTLSLGSASYFIKNYTSISITGSGQLAFSSKHANGTVIVLKSQGGVTLTSSAVPNIECTGLGADAASQPNSNFTNTTDAAGTSGGTGNDGSAGVGGTAPARLITAAILGHFVALRVGAGGGSGGSGGASGGSGGGGGAGGGCIFIECGGALNQTGNIYAKGAAGSDGTNNAGGGGGGGGGGQIFLLYNSLTAASGTNTVSGGAGGDGKNTGGNQPNGGGGGGGASIANGGSNGSSNHSIGVGGDGGAGGAGVAIVAQNYEFA